MAHTFKPIPAKPAFGTLTQVVYQGDYINNKKAKLVYCLNRDKKSCNKLTKAPNYKEYNLYNKGRFLNALDKGCILPFNKTNLIINFYLNLLNQLLYFLQHQFFQISCLRMTLIF